MTTTLHLPVFFSQKTALVEDEAHHHLFKVKRLQTGERLRVVDGEGHARWAEIVGIDKRAARLALGEAAPANEPERAVEIFVAAAKPERIAWLVEKATEIGVVAIHFIACEREARSVELSQLTRLERIAISAVEQSGRSVVPRITVAGAAAQEMARALHADLTIAVLDAAGAPARPAVGGMGRCGLFVGPEGGWSPAEHDQFRNLSVPAWSLGPTVLRVETAAVVAAGCVLCGGGLSR
ncbi:MAG: RsmE family RNA methyltransferase [Thermoanaerobaculia bacterium]